MLDEIKSGEINSHQTRKMLGDLIKARGSPGGMTVLLNGGKGNAIEFSGLVIKLGIGS